MATSHRARIGGDYRRYVGSAALRLGVSAEIGAETGRESVQSIHLRLPRHMTGAGTGSA